MNNNDEREGYEDDIYDWQDDEGFKGFGVIMWGLPLVLGLMFLAVLYLLF